MEEWFVAGELFLRYKKNQKLKPSKKDSYAQSTSQSSKKISSIERTEKWNSKKHTERELRTRQLVHIGDLLQESGLMEAFSIQPDEELQDYENLEKSSQLLGFLSEVFERSTFDKSHFDKWKMHGERLMR